MGDLFNLTGKVAVVIGGNSTLGSVMAKGLAEHGAKIAVVGRNFKTTEIVAKEIKENGHIANAFQADISDLETIKNVAQEIEEWAGGWDILINAAGKNSSTPFFEIAQEEWDDIMNVNLKGVAFTIQHFAKRMIEQERKGSIINISSASSDIPLSKVFTYAASKAGINNMTQFLAREFAPYGIRVNAIVPGFFPAEQNRKIMDDARVESIMNHTPMKRFGKPEELKGATVFLASDQASGFVTGSFLRVDGGYLSMTI
ncbi:SDR family oxidoreductase [Amphibacillus indicireducens]|uniref:SDR family oxidoreductase n=1 Tax=Amphibacillus indicireducens TaxID=1076330 RepID=A0ABP7VH83_9BACI